MALELFDDRLYPIVAAHPQVIALGNVMGEYYSRAFPQAREHGKQNIALQRLRLVHDNEGIVQRTAANMGQWQDLDEPTRTLSETRPSKVS